MIDHVAAEVRIVVVRLHTVIRTFSAREQRVATSLPRRDPVVFPAPPCVPTYGIEEIALDPRCAAIEADPNLRYIGITRPSGAENRIAPARLQRFIYARAGDLRFQLHFGERAANGR